MRTYIKPGIPQHWWGGGELLHFARGSTASRDANSGEKKDIEREREKRKKRAKPHCILSLCAWLYALMSRWMAESPDSALCCHPISTLSVPFTKNIRNKYGLVLVHIGVTCYRDYWLRLASLLLISNCEIVEGKRKSVDARRWTILTGS